MPTDSNSSKKRAMKFVYASSFVVVRLHLSLHQRHDFRRADIDAAGFGGDGHFESWEKNGED